MSSSNNDGASKLLNSDIPVTTHATRATSSRRVDAPLIVDSIHRATSNNATSGTTSNLANNNRDADHSHPQSRTHNGSIDTGSSTNINAPFVLPKGKDKESETIDHWTPNPEPASTTETTAADEPPASPPVQSEKSKGKQRAVETDATSSIRNPKPLTTAGASKAAGARQRKRGADKPNTWTPLAAGLYGTPEAHLREMFILSQKLSHSAELFMRAWPSSACKLGVQDFVQDVFYNLPHYESEVSTCAQILARKINERFRKQPWTIVEKIDAKVTAPPPMLVLDPTTQVPIEIAQVRVERPHLDLRGKPFAMEIRRHAARHYSGNFSVEFRPTKPQNEDPAVSPPPGCGVSVVEGRTEEYEIRRHLVPETPTDEGTPFDNGLPSSPISEAEQEWIGAGFFDIIPPTNTATPAAAVGRQGTGVTPLKFGNVGQEAPNQTRLPRIATPIPKTGPLASFDMFSIRSRAESPDTSSSSDSNIPSSPSSPTMTLSRSRTKSRAQLLAAPSSPTPPAANPNPNPPAATRAPPSAPVAGPSNSNTPPAPEPRPYRAIDLLPPGFNIWVPVRKPLVRSYAQLDVLHGSIPNDAPLRPLYTRPAPARKDWSSGKEAVGEDWEDEEGLEEDWDFNNEEGIEGEDWHDDADLERIEGEEQEIKEQPSLPRSQMAEEHRVEEQATDELEPPSTSHSSAQSQLEVEEVTISILARTPSPEPQDAGDARVSAPQVGVCESEEVRSVSMAVPLVRRAPVGRFAPVQAPSLLPATKTIAPRRRVTFVSPDHSPKFGKRPTQGKVARAPSAPGLPPTSSHATPLAPPVARRPSTPYHPGGQPSLTQLPDSSPAAVQTPAAQEVNTIAGAHEANPFEEPAAVEESVSMIGQLKGRRERSRGRKAATSKAATKRGKRVAAVEKEVELPANAPAERPMETPAEVQVEVAPANRATRGKGKAKATPAGGKEAKGKAKEIAVAEEPSAGAAEPTTVEEVPAPKRGRKRARRDVEDAAHEDADFNRPTRRLRSHTKKMGGGLP